MSAYQSGPAGRPPSTADLVQAGVLVAVPPQIAADAGISVPVTFSAPAWNLYVGGDPTGRLPSILASVVSALTRAPHSESVIIPEVTTADGRFPQSAEQLHGETHPDDDTGWPALLLLLPSDY